MKYSDNPFKHARTPRHDVTGRHSPLHIPREPATPWGFAILGGAAFGCFVAFVLWVSL